MKFITINALPATFLHLLRRRVIGTLVTH